MSNLCNHCILKGDINKCESEECSVHDSWYVQQLKQTIVKKPIILEIDLNQMESDGRIFPLKERDNLVDQINQKKFNIYNEFIKLPSEISDALGKICGTTVSASMNRLNNIDVTVDLKTFHRELVKLCRRHQLDFRLAVCGVSDVIMKDLNSPFAYTNFRLESLSMEPVECVRSPVEIHHHKSEADEE